MLYVDPGSGDTFEFRYIVTQFESEGPEHLDYRNLDRIDNPNADDNWAEWPEELPIPSEVAENFFGKAKGFDVPGFFQVFAELREARDELVRERNNVDLTSYPDLATAIWKMLGVVAVYGDLDEPYSAIASDALAGNDDARKELADLIRPTRSV